MFKINRPLAAKAIWLTPAFLLLSFAVYSQGEKYDISFKMLPDTSYQFVLHVEMDQDVDGTPTTYMMETHGSSRLMGEKDGVKTVAAKYGRQKLHIGMGEFAINVDTDKLGKKNGNTELENLVEPPPAPETIMVPADSSVSDEIPQFDPFDAMQRYMEAVYSVLPGYVFEFKVSESGEIIEFEGAEEMVKLMLDALPGDFGQSSELRSQLESEYNNEKMKKSFASSYDVFSNKPVAIGESWTSTRQVTIGANIDVQIRYTLKKVEGDMVTIAAESKMTPGPDAKETALTGSHKGYIILNRKTGEVIEQRLDVEMQGIANGLPITGGGLVTYKCTL